MSGFLTHLKALSLMHIWTKVSHPKSAKPIEMPFDGLEKLMWDQKSMY